MTICRRWVPAAGLVVALVGVGAPATAAVADSGLVTLRGTYQLLVTDTLPDHGGAAQSGPAQPTQHRQRAELRVGASTYLLRLPAGVRLKGGAGVEVTGRLDGATLTATALTRVAALTQPPVDTTVSTNVLVILAEWRGQDSMTTAAARTQMFTNSANWYSSASYGATTQHGDVTPWVHITGPAGNRCYGDSGTIMAQAKAAAAARYYDADSYDRTIVYFPYDNATDSDCAAYAGWAYQPGTEVWINGNMNTRTLVHEQGHNYGLAHAHSYRCSSGVLTGSCTFSDYGDDYDAMGASNLVAQFSAKQKNQLGWLPATTLSVGTSTALAPLETSSGVRAAVVHATADRDYWVEYRQRTAEDAGLPVGATNGVLVHLVDHDVSAGDETTYGPALLDESPADHSLTDATLKAGQSWVTPEGLRLSVGSLTGAAATVSVTSPDPAAADFTGDGRSDAAVYRPGTGTWYIRGAASVRYGATADVPVPADYNGNGRSDVAVWRPSTGQWFVRGSATVSWGTRGDIPVPADYNGDGRAELAVYRPGTGTWYVRGSASVRYGAATDVPVPADYNGDRRSDLAVWRPSSGQWWVRGTSPVSWGIRGDIAVPQDYTGDGSAQPAVWRPPSNAGAGTWYVRGRPAMSYGSDGDVPSPGDFNGDGRGDPGVWAPASGTWTVSDMTPFRYGTSGDIPLVLPAAIRMTQLGTR